MTQAPPADPTTPRLDADALSVAAAATRHRRRPGVVHLGLGAFHRSHQAWYTQHAVTGPGETPWGIVAFTGRRPDAAETLAEQDAVYTLVTRGSDGDGVELVDAIVAAHDGHDRGRWLAALAAPETAVVTLTVTEAAYRDGDVVSRLVDGLRARRDAAAGPVTVLSCDNLPGNGDVVRRAVLDAVAAEPALAAWIESTVDFASSMVDRITPATTDDDRAEIARRTGYDDRAVVVAEPFAEWVISGAFPAGRPPWETAGARFVDDLEPFEHRKLWLLNAGHSLLAYLGPLLGHRTIAEAMADPRCRAPLDALWDEAAAVLPLPAAEIEEARAALRVRFGNARIEHTLRQIAVDGASKLPVRVVDPLRRRLAAGLAPGEGEATALAAWWLHLTTEPDLVRDARAGALLARSGDRGPTVEAALGEIAADLAADPRLLEAVRRAADRLRTLTEPSPPTGESHA
ncbi:mannitol dehydrogenase family protein [Frigoribacterium sp. 2-23]|uniref:mannitol dehydrogenase family protein n=1 Tax=Frigoribacterium sp. 2-23 TaxID=3415006 RepID=UPI003C6ECEDF